MAEEVSAGKTLLFQICAVFYGLLCLGASFPSLKPTTKNCYAWKMLAFFYGLGNAMALGIDKYSIVKNLPSRLEEIPVFMLGAVFCVLIYCRCVIMRVMLLKTTSFEFSRLLTSPVWWVVFAIPFGLFMVPGDVPLMYVAFLVSSFAIAIVAVYGRWIGSPYVSKYTCAFAVAYALNICMFWFLKKGIPDSLKNESVNMIIHFYSEYGEVFNVILHVFLVRGIFELDQVKETKSKK